MMVSAILLYENKITLWLIVIFLIFYLGDFLIYLKKIINLSQEFLNSNKSITNFYQNIYNALNNFCSIAPDNILALRNSINSLFLCKRFSI